MDKVSTGPRGVNVALKNLKAKKTLWVKEIWSNFRFVVCVGAYKFV